VSLTLDVSFKGQAIDLFEARPKICIPHEWPRFTSVASGLSQKSQTTPIVGYAQVGAFAWPAHMGESMTICGVWG
jgi:hypothetical protein